MIDIISDGILKKDWKKLEDLALEYVDTCEESQEERIRRNILSYLNTLSSKYGEKASIIATKADYVKPIKLKLRLLLDAYRIAESTNDLQNKALISLSISELYIDEIEDYAKGITWLDVLEKNLNDYNDPQVKSMLARLREYALENHL